MSYKIETKAFGKYLPKEVITNEDISKFVDTSDEWITTRTGIKERRKAKETVLELAYLAAVDAINNSKYDVDKIDLIIVATITAEQKTPAVANLLQAKLGLNGKQVMAFDVNAACTGFVYALEIASSLLQGSFNSALVVGVEKMTNVIDFSDRSTCILFGDAAGAMIVEKGDDISHFYNDSRGDDKNILGVTDRITMNGPRVYQFAVETLNKSITKILADNNMTLADIDVIIPHQANIRIIDTMIKDLNLDEEKVLVNIQHYGNTSAASIPVTIAEYKEKVKEKKTALLIGFGGGFTWGAAIIKI